MPGGWHGEDLVVVGNYLGEMIISRMMCADWEVVEGKDGRKQKINVDDLGE